MDGDQLRIVSAAGIPASSTPSNRRWEARLNLAFKHANGRSFLANNLHFGPLVLQKTLYPEGDAVCHGVVIHPPGGVAGGDELTINVDMLENTHALLTTPGAGKWYKANGQSAKQHLNFNLRANACLEWLPQENILFNGAKVKFSAEVNLAQEAKYAAWEILCFGRQAQCEQWQTGLLMQKLSIRRAGKLIWNERAFLEPTQYTNQSIVGLRGNVVSSSFVVAAGQVPSEVLDACRMVKPKTMLDANAQYGVTALPEIFCARYVGSSSQCAREYFEKLWQHLRPWYGAHEVTRPRIWNT